MRLTIWSLTVFESRSIVLIFYIQIIINLIESEKYQNRAYKVDSDGGDVALRVRIVCESQQQTGLPHSRVADQQKFKEVVVLGVHGKARIIKEGGRGREGRA